MSKGDHRCINSKHKSCFPLVLLTYHSQYFSVSYFLTEIHPKGEQINILIFNKCNLLLSILRAHQRVYHVINLGQWRLKKNLISDEAPCQPIRLRLANIPILSWCVMLACGSLFLVEIWQTDYCNLKRLRLLLIKQLLYDVVVAYFKTSCRIREILINSRLPRDYLDLKVRLHRRFLSRNLTSSG